MFYGPYGPYGPIGSTVTGARWVCSYGIVLQYGYPRVLWPSIYGIRGYYEHILWYYDLLRHHILWHHDLLRYPILSTN